MTLRRFRVSDDQLVDLLLQALQAGRTRSLVARTVLDEADKVIADHLLNASVNCACPPCKAVNQLLSRRPS